MTDSSPFRWEHRRDHNGRWRWYRETADAGACVSMVAHGRFAVEVWHYDAWTVHTADGIQDLEQALATADGLTGKGSDAMTTDNRTVGEKFAAGVYDVSSDERSGLAPDERDALYRSRKARFRAVALREVGLAGHPKADRAFDAAFDWSDSTEGRLASLAEIAKLLLED